MGIKVYYSGFQNNASFYKTSDISSALIDFIEKNKPVDYQYNNLVIEFYYF